MARPLIDVQYLDRWTPEGVADRPETIFVFGDNTKRRGRGGQACIRGLPNAIGICTKLKPAMTPDAFFNDDSFDANAVLIADDFKRLWRVFDSGGNNGVVPSAVCFSSGGLGTGLAQMPKKAPRTYAFLQQCQTMFVGCCRGEIPVSEFTALLDGLKWSVEVVGRNLIADVSVNHGQ